MNSLFKIKKTFFCASLLFLMPLFFLNAYEIRDTSTEFYGDFALEPAKRDIQMNPGDIKIEILNILNRTDKTLDFKVELEDFIGSQDPSETVILKGDEKGPYSLKDFITPEITSFTLEPGQKIILPVTISVPKDAEPGGLYGSVLFSSQANATGGMGTTIISRLGALLFVDVSGEARREGELTSFKKIDTEAGQTSFELLFTNTGNVHLNPFGSVKIFNLAGNQIDEINISQYFAMPDSVRYRKIEWDKGKLFGRYKAVASISRGYDDLVDEMTITFWAISTKTLVTILGGIILLILILTWLIRTFDFHIVKQKKKEDVSSTEGSNSSFNQNRVILEDEE